jgi:phosphatidylserine/phosphatidylglycerophosphate/cardiolipin synthase-like enzyme
MDEDVIIAVEDLVRKAPATWLMAVCKALRSFPATAKPEFVLQRLPPTNNADLAFVAKRAVQQAATLMSWESLSWTLQTTYAAVHRSQADQQVEMLWSGPSPADQIPARRIDQALYDLIAGAKNEVLLVTFAATKVERLAGELLKAIQRGVRVRLILEFEQSSEGQLSYDAIKAFPPALVSAAEIYYWPVEKRERNQAGRPGKLHAKLAVVDDTALVSSANLTDDAFNRNLELGVLVNNPSLLRTVREHIHTLITDGTFCLVT